MFKVIPKLTKGYSGSNLKKLEKSLALFERAMNHEHLRTSIVSYSSPMGDHFADNDGLTNEQVFEKLVAATEHYDKNADYEADLYLVLTKKRKPLLAKYRTIGYGQPNQKEIYTYSWYFEEAAPPQIAGHIAHEWAHKLGFRHDHDPTPHREHSVPYAFGYIIKDLCTQF